MQISNLSMASSPPMVWKPAQERYHQPTPTLSAVSTRGTLASLKNVLERRLEQTVAHLIPAVS